MCKSSSKRRIRKASKKVTEEDGTFAIQSDLNEVFVGPVFDFTVSTSSPMKLSYVID